MNVRYIVFGGTPALGLLMLTLTLALPFSASAQGNLGVREGFQDLPRVGIGYVTNAPNIFTGASLYGVVDRLGGIGLYVDAKVTRSSPADEPDYVDSITYEEASATYSPQMVRDSAHAWVSLNAALLKTLTPELMLYLGGGYTDQETYRRFGVPESDLGEFGHFWVHDRAASGGRINILGGAFFRISRHVALQFGLESAPRGLTVGGSYSFSL